MARLCIDDSRSEVSNENIIIGKLLDEIEGKLPVNRIMTNLMLNGKYIGRFEWEKLRDYQLNNDDELCVQTTDKSIWAVNGIDIALNSLERVQQTLLSVIEFLKNKQLAKANLYFVRCLEGLERFSEVMSVTKYVLKLNYEKIFVGNVNLSKIEKELSQILCEIFECQQKDSYEELAEVIDYELIANLSYWQQCLRYVKNSFSSDA